MKKIIPSVISASDLGTLQKALEAEIELRYDEGLECWGMTLGFQPDGRPVVVCMFEQKDYSKVVGLPDELGQ